jgi:16S rRNA (cytidine1402-2'-O)-methyltransferase
MDRADWKPSGESRMSMGSLYIVATPIGNLEDITDRAKRVLSEVDLIAAEDTRHSAKMLRQLHINTPLVAMHDHNERQFAPVLIDKIRSGQSIALISDAGTPLLSDPGFGLVDLANSNGIGIVPVVGASALMAALSVAGMPVDRFIFEGFLPAKQLARIKRLQSFANEPRTIIFFEAPHRIISTLTDMKDVFGGQRLVSVARELTKVYEQIVRMELDDVLGGFASGEIKAKGEFVLLLGGNTDKQSNTDLPLLLKVLLDELPPGKVAAIAHKLTGENKKTLYKMILAQKGQDDQP